MSGTQVTFIRRPTLVDGANQFEVVATCLVAGSLPDTNIFVLSVVQEEDPKSDTLLRVAAIQDFGNYLATRATAIDEGYVTWRSSSVTLRYSDLTTANAAASELSSRVNALVEDQDVNLLEFETGTGGELITFPVVDPSQKTALIDAADAASLAISPAEDTRDTKRVECEALQVEVDVLEERLLEAQGDLATATSILAELTPISTGLVTSNAGVGTATSTVRVLNNGSSASTAEKANIETQVLSLESFLLTWTTQNTNLNTVISSQVTSLQTTLQARIASLSSQRNTALTSLARCNQQLAAAQGAVDAARDARDTAVAAVLAVCPDYVFTA